MDIICKTKCGEFVPKNKCNQWGYKFERIANVDETIEYYKNKENYQKQVDEFEKEAYYHDID